MVSCQVIGHCLRTNESLYIFFWNAVMASYIVGGFFLAVYADDDPEKAMKITWVLFGILSILYNLG